MLVIGLMSGTSADGVDAALVDWPEDATARPFRLVAFEERIGKSALQAFVWIRQGLDLYPVAN